MNVYDKLTAYYPRNDTDKFFDVPSDKKFEGCLDKSLAFISRDQLEDVETWSIFVEQFRNAPDDAQAWWRGEFWGKMMRGASFVYAYSKNENLYSILENAVKDLLTTQDSYGRISTYSLEREFDGWDLWGRKYVLLGMQYFLEICKDEQLKNQIIDSMCRQVDYLISKIGYAWEGKKVITKLTRHWRGLNSSSILEPVVRLYSLTGEQKYLDFATCIVECGFTDVRNIWKLAYENKLRPYQYPVTKAYEMTSCFMGLLEYYRITKNEMHLQAILNYADCVLEDDFTVIGSAGCTHELFDHSTVRQANPDRGDPRAQETCVTVTLMQFFNQLNLITGNSKYIDAFEISLYNGYLGAINTDGAIDLRAKELYPDVTMKPKTFDSYSPLTPGHRGNGIGGFTAFGGKSVTDGPDFDGCCICIGSAGIGMAMKTAVLSSENGVVINLFEKGTVKKSLLNGGNVELNVDTEYPTDGRVKITVNTDVSDAFDILVRNPNWSKNTAVTVNGELQKVQSGYITLNRVWHNGDVIDIDFEMKAEAIYPIPYGSQILMNEVIWGVNYMVSTYDEEHPSTKNHIAIKRGPLMLAQENRLGYSVDDAVSVKVEKDGTVDVKIHENKTAPYACLLEVGVPTTDGDYFTVTDYASTGKLWNDESKMAVWMNTK